MQSAVRSIFRYLQRDSSNFNYINFNTRYSRQVLRQRKLVHFSPDRKSAAFKAVKTYVLHMARPQNKNEMCDVCAHVVCVLRNHWSTKKWTAFSQLSAMVDILGSSGQLFVFGYSDGKYAKNVSELFSNVAKDVPFHLRFISSLLHQKVTKHILHITQADQINYRRIYACQPHRRKI